MKLLTFAAIYFGAGLLATRWALADDDLDPDDNLDRLFFGFCLMFWPVIVVPTLLGLLMVKR